MVSIYLIAIVKLKGNVSIYEKEMVSICLKATVRRNYKEMVSIYLISVVKLKGNIIYLLDSNIKMKRK